MSPVRSLFSDHQPPPKRSRVEAESTFTASYLGQTHPTSEQGIFTDVRYSGSSAEDEGIGIVVDVEDEQKEDVMELSNVNRLSHGSVSLIGRRRVMEDAITVAPTGLPSYCHCEHVFFAVYDGQGGPWVSVACHERLHLILADEILRQRAGSGLDWRRVMRASFKNMDEVLKGFSSRNGGLVDDGLDGAAPYETTGSTATVVMVGEKEIVVANCGDSRAVLYSGGVALTLSVDHKPYEPSERMRLEHRGLEIQFDLPVSRSIGHCGHVLKQHLIADPDVNVYERRNLDEFLIIASHGLWDVVSNEDAYVIVKKCLDGQMKRNFEEIPVASPTVAATTLAEFAIARGSKDNISLVVVEL